MTIITITKDFRHANIFFVSTLHGYGFTNKIYWHKNVSKFKISVGKKHYRILTVCRLVFCED